MQFNLSKHAQEELIKRNIPLQVLQFILNEPSQIIQEKKLTIYQGLFTGYNGKTYLLKVFVNPNLEPVKVITIYKTSKISKYWRNS